MSLQSGSITINAAQGLFNDFENKMKGIMNNLLDEKLAEIRPSSSLQNVSAPPSRQQASGSTHCWGGRMWDVPEKWTFPKKTTRSTGWRLWLCGIPSQLVKPFRSLNPLLLPKAERIKFKTEWRPIFSRMEQGITRPIPINPTDSIVNSTFDEGTKFLKTKLCAFIWENNKFKSHDDWNISTWSVRTNYKSIEQFGTASDKSHMPAATHHNRNKRRRMVA